MASARLNADLAARSGPRLAGRAKRLLLPAVLMALAGSLVFVTSLPPLCPLRIVFGLPCPSCGLTRATRLAVGGDFAGATHMHPLWFVVLPFVAGIAYVQITRYVRTGETTSFEGNAFVTGVAKALLALLIVVWIARFFGVFGGPCPV